MKLRRQRVQQENDNEKIECIQRPAQKRCAARVPLLGAKERF
jgi:hypothetical protein